MYKKGILATSFILFFTLISGNPAFADAIAPKGNEEAINILGYGIGVVVLIIAAVLVISSIGRKKKNSKNNVKEL